MKVFYYCRTGKYAALLAAALHIKSLPINLPFNQFLSYIKTINLKSYEPFFLGEDHNGTKVYVVGTRTEEKLVATIIKSFVHTFITDDKNVLVINSLPNPNFFLICILKLNALGIIKYFFQSLIPYAVWLNRKAIQNYIYNPN